MDFYLTFALFLVPFAAAYYYFGNHFDPESVRGKRVLVTGASSGIGEELALKYAHLGTQLVITARRKALLEKVAEKCKQAGAKKVLSVVADMELPSDRKKLVDATLKELGGLDILVLNHAIIDMALWLGTPENMTKFESIVNINFVSYVDLTSQFLGPLEKSKGRIAVVSSIFGKFSFIGYATYCSTKHALQGFYSALRQELKFRNTGISVTLAIFGFIKTQKIVDIMEAAPLDYDLVGKAGEPEEAADAVVKGASARKYEVYYPTVATIMVWFHKMFPYFSEDLQHTFLQTALKFNKLN